MFVSTRYTLSHRATQALSAATATTCTDRDSVSVRRPIAGPAFASAPASSTLPAPSRNPRPCVEHRGEDHGSFLPASSWLQDKPRALQSQSNRHPTDVKIGRKSVLKL